MKRKKKATSGVEEELGSPGRKRGGKSSAGKEKAVAEKARKAAEKEAVREARRQEKAARALEKQKGQELATVNKLRTSKKESIKEMIIDISRSYAATPGGEQLIRFLRMQDCEITTAWESLVSNAVKWRRRLTAEWSEELGCFVPVSMAIQNERHILVVVKAEDFVDMAMGDEGLERHVQRTKEVLGDGEAEMMPIYLIEGLAALLRKSRNARNRSFQGAVRQAMQGSDSGGDCTGASTRGRGRGRAGGPMIVDEDLIEDALLGLQIAHGCLVHHTASMQETSEWISIFTGDISTIPYKKSRTNFDTAFCTDLGQVKTGTDPEDTYFKMLQEINRVTAGVANGIMGEYKSVKELVKACKKEGEMVVADLDIMANRNGTATGRAIGQATSKRIYKIFMRLDPDSTDV
ncbi:ERCC4 domain-containing protein [Kalaharituber pfeilii]|nr:ERCC4 domain-containing protein [Kalaharituber pfeilii]